MMKIFSKRLGVILAVLVAGIVGTGLIARHWIIPGIIAAKIQSAAAEQWDGAVKVGVAEISFSGPIVIRNLEFYDPAQRLWLHIDRIELALRHWPSLSPVITTVDIRKATINTHFINGRLDLPARKQKKPSVSSADMSNSCDIQKLTVRNISYRMVDDHAHQAKWAFETFEATRQTSGVYQVSLTSLSAAEEAPPLSLSGSVDPKTYDANLILDGNLSADSSRMAVMLHALNVSVIKGIEGRLHSENARLHGRLNDPGHWQLGGQIDLKGFGFEGPYGHLAQELNCTMKLDGRTIRITQFSANGCGGSVTVSGQADIEPDWKVSYRGMLDASNVDVPRLTETVAGPDNKAQRGTLLLQIKFSGVDGNLRGSGLLGLDNADVMTLSIFAEIFKQMNLGSSDQLRKSDVRTVLAFNGPQVTIEHGRLANPLSALEVEKGGQINVQTHQLDLYVIGVPLKAVEGILNLPLIGILSEPFRNLRDKLIRLHIQGDWSAPPSAIVKKEPVTDVSEGTVGFFKDVAKSGGKLGEGVLKTVNDIFRTLGGD